MDVSAAAVLAVDGSLVAVVTGAVTAAVALASASPFLMCQHVR